MIVGRTNVGKSTLFNRLLNEPLAVTAYDRGTTRDSNAREVQINERKYLLTDTAGLIEESISELDQIILSKLEAVLSDADLYIYVVDGRQPYGGKEKEIYNQLLKYQKPIIVAVNKADHPNTKLDPFWVKWAVEPKVFISSQIGRNINELEDLITKQLKGDKSLKNAATRSRIFVIGRPNVGKSTLINTILDEDKLITSPIAGTTRDTLQNTTKLQGHDIALYDTPGIRKRGKMEVGVEKFGVHKALFQLQTSDLILLIVDALEGATRGDVHILEQAHKMRIPLIIVFNKTDLIDQSQPIFQRFAYIEKFPQITVSAKEKTNIDTLLKLINDRIS